MVAPWYAIYMSVWLKIIVICCPNIYTSTQKQQQLPELHPCCSHIYKSALLRFAVFLLHPHSSLQAVNESVPLMSVESCGTELLKCVEEAEWRQQSSFGPWRLDGRGMMLSKLYGSVTQQDQSVLRPSSSPVSPLRLSLNLPILMSFCITPYWFSLFELLSRSSLLPLSQTAVSIHKPWSLMDGFMYHCQLLI